MNNKLDDLLKVQARLEKDVTRSFNVKEHSFIPLFGNFEETLTHQRNTEYYNLKQRIGRIRSSTVHFKRELLQATGPSLIEKVKQSLEEIEQSILSFKENQRQLYEQLLLEEASVYQEVLAYERRIESWLTNKPNRQPTAPPSIHQQPPTLIESTNNANSGSGHVPSAVTVFERFLSQSGGHTGGWEELDHLTFVRLKRKQQGGASFTETIATEIPTHSLDEITKHDQWYTEYCRLMEDKKKAIAEWKMAKKVSLRSKEQESNQDQDNEDREARLRQTARDKLFQKEKEERFAKLKDWKTEKIKQQEEEQKKSEELMKDELKRRKQKEIERKNITRTQLDQYSRKKDEEKQKIAMEEELKANEAKERSRLANKQIRKFRQRDTVSMKEKQERLLLHEQEQLEVEKKLDRLRQTVVVTATRDPNRLHELTTGWKERRKADNEPQGYGSERGSSILQISRRAVPQWRIGL